MSNINDYLDYISTANYGSDVREAIVSSIRECYKDATGHPDSVAALVQEYIDREESIDDKVSLLTGLYNSLGEIVYSYDYNNNISGIHITENDEFGCVDQITLGPGKWIIKVVSWFAIISNASPDIGIMYLSFSNTLDSDGFPIPLNDTYNYKDDSYSGTILNSSGSHTHFVKMIELTEERTIYMWIKHTGRLSSDIVVSPHMTAMKIGESTPSDGTSLVDQVVENTEDIVVLEGKVATNISDISTLDGDVSTLQDDVNDIEDEITDIKADLSEYESIFTADVGESVSNWLDEHPEATTTVEDGAITPPKLNTELYKSYKEGGSVLYFFPSLVTGGYSGNCSLVVTPKKTILFDCGPTTDWTDIKSYLDKLYSDGVFTNIDYIVISHFHYDHIENLGSILTTYPHNNCHAYIPMNPTGYTTVDVSSNRTAVISALTGNNVEYTEVTQDTNVTIDESLLEMELFNSNATDYSYYNTESPSVYNNYSMVALLKCGNVYSMFPGDIQQKAQIRIIETRELPRLFLYCVHHHGIQNDDYRPYLEAIDPQYSVIMTSHNRALSSAASSYSGNYLSGDVGSTGFSSYEYVSGKDGGSIVSGLPIPKIGWYYSYVDLYVDNSYSGSVYDGTEEHPFTQINEAIMFVNQSSNLHYTIRVKGTTNPYEYVWLRDMTAAIELIGVNGENDSYPEITGLYIRACANVSLSNFTIKGVGRTVNNIASAIYIWASTGISMTNCVIDGSLLPTTQSNRYAIQLRESHLYIASCTIQNVKSGISTYREGSITTNGITFINVTNGCYSTVALDLIIRGTDSVTSCNYYIIGGTNNGWPYTISKDKLVSSLLLLNSDTCISKPFYYDASNPVAICCGKKVYNMFTGAEITIS